MLAATALLVLTLAPAASVAVVDLSATPQSAFLEAMRKAPGVKGRALASARTSAVVEDAKGLGLDCRVSDDKCLEKLVVLLGADELIAFSLERGSVKLVRIAAGQTQRAKVKFSAPSTTARAAMAALEDAGAPAAVSDPVKDEVAPPVAPPRSEPDEIAKDERPKGATDEPKDASSLVEDTDGIDLSPALAIGVVGGGVGIGCGVGALGVSADLARQQVDASATDPAQRRPIDPGAYDRGNLAFGALGICAIAGLVTAGVGMALFFTEEAPSEAPADEPTVELGGS